MSVLKIDRAFVDGIDKSAENRAIVQAIAGLGRSLGLKLVAEGVETREQHQELESYGCDLLQGYHFSRPIDPDAFGALFERQASEHISVDPPLYFLIYASRATRPMHSEEFSIFRRQAAASNRALGITGCLLYEDGYYLQMLEGREEVVLALLERISRDNRHQDLEVVMRAPTRHRVFKDWGMAFHGFRAGTPEIDFTPWQRRRITFLDLAKDARACYAHLTAYAGPARSA